MTTETLLEAEDDTSGETAELRAGVGRKSRNAPYEVKSYDFRRPHRVSKERLRTLEAMYERLVKSLEGWLVGRVRSKVELKLLAVDQLSFGEYTSGLQAPCSAYVFTVEDSGGQKGVVELGQDFSYFLVDRLFGGGGAPKLFNRGLTPIERMAVRVVAERTVGLLAEVWQDHVVLEMELTGFESVPEILQAEGRDDPMLIGRVGVNTAGMESGMAICLPLSVLEKFFSGGGQRRLENLTGSEKERQVNRELAEVSLRATPVAVSARLSDFPMTMRELAGLREGSVLNTGIPTDSELCITVSGQPRFRGMAGRVGRRLAVRVISPIENGTDPSSSSFSTHHR